MLLIQSNKNVLKKLSNGFPEYFIDDLSQQLKPPKGLLLQSISDVDRIEDVINIIKGFQLPYEKLNFTGHWECDTLQVSYWSYNVVGSYFRSCKKRVGQVISYKDTLWYIVLNAFKGRARFDGHFTDKHTLILIPISAFDS